MPFNKRTKLFTINEYNELSQQMKYYYRKKRPDLLINIVLDDKRYGKYINHQVLQLFK